MVVLPSQKGNKFRKPPGVQVERAPGGMWIKWLREMTEHNRLINAFGSLISKLRKQRGWTQYDLADRLEFNGRYGVTYLERIAKHNRPAKKEASVTLRTMIDVANAFDMSLVEFVGQMVME